MFLLSYQMLRSLVYLFEKVRQQYLVIPYFRFFYDSMENTCGWLIAHPCSGVHTV
jgi:hypothetical protein